MEPEVRFDGLCGFFSSLDNLLLKSEADYIDIVVKKMCWNLSMFKVKMCPIRILPTTEI